MPNMPPRWGFFPFFRSDFHGKGHPNTAAPPQSRLPNSDMKTSTQTPTPARPARGRPSRHARQHHQPSTHSPSTVLAVESRLRLRDDFFRNQISPRELLQPFNHLPGILYFVKDAASRLM